MNRSPTQTSPYYFISYSRQEVTFVDNFAKRLEKEGIRTWVDFRNLIPGRNWQPQLDDGVNNASAILLVVSKASMSSGPVMDEVKKSIKAGRRIIMIVFEPTRIDDQLKGREWIDFSVDFETAVDVLKLLLTLPEKRVDTLPPEKHIRKRKATKKSIFWGVVNFIRALASVPVFIIYIILMFITRVLFGAEYLPKGVISFFFWSITVTVFSFFSLEFTNVELGADSVVFFFYLYFSWTFLQFPVRVRMRTHSAEKLRDSIYGLSFLSLLPAFLWIGYFFGFVKGLDQDLAWITIPITLTSLGGCYYLYRLLISDAFYRWAGPAGALVRTPRPDLTKHLNDDQSDTLVAIEFALQDKAYALELKDSIIKARYTYTDDIDKADIVLTLLSAYQNSSKCDPQNKYVVPILLQSFADIDDGEPNEFSKIQWIDLRHGKASMNAVANLLDEPEDLLRVLGTIPMRTSILPNGVNFLVGLMSWVLISSAFFTFTQIWSKLNPGSSTNLASGLEVSDYLGILFVIGLYVFRRIFIKRRFWLVKNRMHILYKTGGSSLVRKWIIPFMEKRKMFVGLEAKLNERLGNVMITFPWAFAFSILLTALAFFAFPNLWILFALVCIIPVLLILKPSRMWLPAKAG